MKRFETRAVLAATYPRIGGSSMLTHTVEVEDGIPVAVVCRRVKLDSLADSHAADPTAPPTCARCLQGWRVRQVERIKRDRDARAGKPVVDPDLVRREAEASMRPDEGFTRPIDDLATLLEEARKALDHAVLVLEVYEAEGRKPTDTLAGLFCPHVRALIARIEAYQHQASTKRDTE